VFGQNGFSPMNGNGHAARTGPVGLRTGPVEPRMGQSAPAPAAPLWWPSEGLAAVQAWDALVARLAKVQNPDAQKEILAWIGRSDTPGSPAERYQVVADDVRTNYSPLTQEQVDALRRRVDQLEANASEFEARVKNAEQAYGVFVASTEAPNMPEHDMMMECVTGGIALLGLVIMPLLLD